MSIFAGLYQEWAGLALAPTTTATLRRWGSEDPNLAGLATMAELEEAAHYRADPGRSNDILFALARRSGNDALAARTLLQLMLPGLYALTRRCRRLGTFDDRASMVLATAFERIRTYPLSRPGRVATNIMLDTMRRVYDAARTQDRLDDHDRLDDEAPGPAQSDTSELLELLAWARQRGHLSADAAALVALVRVVEVPVTELVGRFGTDPQSIRRRRQRAEGRLREAVLAAA